MCKTPKADVCKLGSEKLVQKLLLCMQKAQYVMRTVELKAHELQEVRLPSDWQAGRTPCL